MIESPIDRLNSALDGRYRVEREVGAGGMATVYLATDVRHERHIALKVLKPELAAVPPASPEFVLPLCNGGPGSNPTECLTEDDEVEAATSGAVRPHAQSKPLEIARGCMKGRQC